MKIMRGSNKRPYKRSKTVLRCVRSRMAKLKKYEDFEDITSGFAGTEGNAMFSEQISQEFCDATPRNAFDIVSEYLTHSIARESRPVKLNRHNTRRSVTVKHNHCPLSIVNSDQTATDDSSCRTFPIRTGNRNLNHGVFIRRSNNQSVLNRTTNEKGSTPLSEVNNNLKVPNSMDPPKKPIHSGENTMEDRRMMKPDDVASMPFLKTLLTGSQDVPNSANALDTLSSQNCSTDGEPHSNVANPNGQSVEENTPVESGNSAKEKTVVIVTINHESEPISLITPVGPTQSNPQSLAGDKSRGSMGSLSDVHTLIRCAALAGSDLVDNQGLANSSMISHISSTVFPSTGASLPSDVKRAHPVGRRPRSGKRRATTDISSASLYQCNTPLANKKQSIHKRHPFMHFWESEDDHVAVNRRWRSRRCAYLSLLCSRPEADQSDAAVDSGARQARRRSDYSGLFYPLGKGGVYSRLHLDDDEGSVAAQTQMLAQLEPVILGYRWPDSSQASAEADREVMLLWN